MSTSSQVLGLAEAAVARVCHDLGGALGAIGNAVGLAQTPDGPLAAEALALADEASSEATARLRLARALWSPGSLVSSRDINSLGEGLPGRERFHLDLSKFDPADISSAQTRAILAALLVAAEALHGPGVISLAASSSSNDVLIGIDGLRAAWPAELPMLLAEPEAAAHGATARNIAPRLLAALLPTCGGHASLLLAVSSDGPPPLLIQFRS